MVPVIGTLTSETKDNYNNSDLGINYEVICSISEHIIVKYEG